MTNYITAQFCFHKNISPSDSQTIVDRVAAFRFMIPEDREILASVRKMKKKKNIVNEDLEEPARI